MQRKNELKDYVEKLDGKIWRTKGARFNAYRRLKRKHYASLFAITFLSFYALVITIANGMDYKIIQISENAFSAINISLSIFILILSTLEIAKNYQSDSENLHRCAIQLNKVYEQLELAKIKYTENEIKEIASSYHNIIASYSQNHEPLDDILFKFEHPHIFYKGQPGLWVWIKKWLFRIWYMLRYYGFYAILVSLPPLLLAASHDSY